MLTDRPRLWQLLRSLDDPNNLEFPANYFDLKKWIDDGRRVWVSAVLTGWTMSCDGIVVV
jgi:hypothetical protein